MHSSILTGHVRCYRGVLLMGRDAHWWAVRVTSHVWYRRWLHPPLSCHIPVPITGRPIADWGWVHHSSALYIVDCTSRWVGVPTANPRVLLWDIALVSCWGSRRGVTRGRIMGYTYGLQRKNARILKLIYRKTTIKFEKIKKRSEKEGYS